MFDLAYLRSFRVRGSNSIFDGVAYFDLLSAFAGSAILFESMGYGYKTGLVVALPLGIAVHWILGVKTKLTLPRI